jgi:hypothetical protein
MLLTIFHAIPDHRRPQGRIYDLAFVLLFTVLAIMSGADSYRTVASFIKVHFPRLKERFHLKWRKPPGYTTIRKIIHGVDSQALEQGFRAYADTLRQAGPAAYDQVSLDGKTVRGSFDRFKGQKAVQVFSAFLTAPKIILGHELIPDRKTNEIPVLRHLIHELNLTGCLLTADAMHGQKKRLPQLKTATTR